MKKQQTTGFFLVILSAVVFGLNPLLAKTIYLSGSNSMTLTVHRMLFGSIGLLIIHKMTGGGSLKVSWDEMKKLLLCALGFGSTPVLLFSSYNYLSSGMATTIHFVYPVLVLVGCVLFCHAKLTRVKLTCSVLCMAGIVCFYTPGGSVSLFGMLIAFCSGATYAFYIIYLSMSGLQHMPAYKLGFWMSFLSAVGVAVVALFTKQLTFQLTAGGWGLTVVFALLTGCVASMAFQVGAKYVGPQNASLLSTFEPLTSVIVGVLVYNEALTARSVGGIVCILLSVVLLTLLGKSE